MGEGVASGRATHEAIWAKPLRLPSKRLDGAPSVIAIMLHA